MRIRSVGLRLALWLAVLVAIAGSNSSAEPSSVAPVTFAILRQDGTVIPFASWDGKRWGNSWPVPLKRIDVPISFNEIPKRWWQPLGPVATWHAWQVDGSQFEARVTAPTWLPAHCLQAVGLRTSLPPRGPTPPLRLQPYPKVGVATSRPLALESISVVPLDAPVVRVLIEAIETQVRTDEEKEARQYLAESGWQHPYEADARRRTPLKVEALYRTPLDPSRSLYYFEAAKRYAPRSAVGRQKTTPAPPADPCEVATFVSGWFEAGPSGTAVTIKTSQTRMTSCDYESVDVMLPLAHLTLDGRQLWIAQFSGWDRERYLLIDPQRPLGQTVVWSTPGGRCLKGE